MTSTVVPKFVDNTARFRNPAKPETAPAPETQPEAPVDNAAPANAEFAQTVTKLTHENILDHLEEIPQVRGYRVLLIPVGHGDTTRGGIALPEEYVEKQRNHAQVFRVVGMGSQAYKDPDRFPDGPYCELGDYVFLGRYAGTRITTYYCDELRVVNDDEIMALVPDVESTIDLV